MEEPKLSEAWDNIFCMVVLAFVSLIRLTEGSLYFFRRRLITSLLAASEFSSTIWVFSCASNPFWYFSAMARAASSEVLLELWNAILIAMTVKIMIGKHATNTMDDCRDFLIDIGVSLY